jgi:rhodanese-related sulfurtransferase
MSEPSAPPFSQITVEELAHQLATAPGGQQLIDVREPWEVETANVQGFINLPLSEFAAWSGEIDTRFDRHKETLVLCHHGMRSAQMCQWLVNQGFTHVKNIIGGIEAYATVIDRTVPRY